MQHKKVDSTSLILLRLAKEFQIYRSTMVLVVLLGILISAIQPITVRLSQSAIDSMKAGQSIEAIQELPLLIVILFLMSGIAKFFHNTLRRTTAEKVVMQLRTALFQRFLHTPLWQLDAKKTGDWLSTIQNDLAQINGGIDTICDLLKEPITFLGLLGTAIYYDWKLALSSAIIAPIVVLLFSKPGEAVKKYSAKTLLTFSDLTSLGQEAITGARVVKTFQLEKELTQRFDTVQKEYFRNVCKSIRVQELGTPAVEFVGAILVSGVLVYGGYRIQTGEMTIGSLVGFVLALGLAQMPIKKLNNLWLRLRIAEAAAERIYAILDLSHFPNSHALPGTTPQLIHPKKPKQTQQNLSCLQKKIEYQDVSFHYGKKQALSQVSFSIEAGECFALVGESGSGKTTTANLLPKLYEPTGGNILWDGVGLSHIDPSEIRKWISVVTQDTFLFHESILENIRYGKLNATQNEIEEAAERAHCLDFIRRFPEGFHTKVGDRGVALSGGERQRIAIARAILKAAPVLILDEATAHLDSHSEAIVQKALDELMKGKTTLLVAHRFSTVLRANRIAVFSHGKIAETGNHRELLEQQGMYKSLYEKQFNLSIL